VRAPSGDQHRLRAAGYEAVVTGVGATVRRLRFRDRDLVASFDEDELRPAMHGALLAPWPGRTGDGRYTFDGASHQLPLDDVELRHATHGLVAWLDFGLVSAGPDRVALAATLPPRPGYPWRLRLDVSFHLRGDGLTQEVVATNQSTTPAPLGLGAHPYLLAGPAHRGAVDDWTLEVPAERLLVTDARRLPVREAAVDEVASGRCDFRRPRVVGDVVLDRSFTALRRDGDGRATVRVLDGRGDGAAVSWDERCPWVHVYSSDLGEGDRLRASVAVEPMTCPPDALRSGRDLLVVPPGSSACAAWRIEAC